MLAHTRALHLEHFLTLLLLINPSTDITRDLCIRDSERQDEEAGLDDLLEAQCTCLALIKDIKDTGCTGPETVRWLNALVDRVIPPLADFLGEGERVEVWKGAQEFAREIVETSERCFGGDSVEYAQSVLRRERVGNCLAGAVERLEGLEESKKKLGGGKKGKKVKKVEGRKEAGGEKQEWAIVGTVAPKDGEEVVKDIKGKVVGKLGDYTVVRD